MPTLTSLSLLPTTGLIVRQNLEAHARSRFLLCASILPFVLLVASCRSPEAAATDEQLVEPWVGLIAPIDDRVSEAEETLDLLPQTSPTQIPTVAFAGTPTPDPFRDPPPVRTEQEWYVVHPGDSLNVIAGRFGVSGTMVKRANDLLNPDFLSVGQLLLIPAPSPQEPGPAFKIIPDSDLVYGPTSLTFDHFAEIRARGGLLDLYVEEVEGVEMGGASIVQLVAERYSVSPRLLLALLEYQSGWLSQPQVTGIERTYPMGYVAYTWEGLWSQLSWAADQLNHGYYLWKAGWAGPMITGDGAYIPPGKGINAGTAAVQYLFAQLYPSGAWREIVSEGGFFSFYQALYGNPFQRAVEPLVPPDLKQPPLQLPFEEGKTWSFTGGPHSAWGEWAAWGALDFAPPGFAYGCVQSDEWVVAAADGLVVRVDEGTVLLDLDMDGYEQTGWVLLYMHVESWDRVQTGTVLRAGDRIGHPSCEGGVTTGTHLHIARKYHGEWISADGPIEFILDGWVASGTGTPYDGYLSKGTDRYEACACRNEDNQITR
ncbi:MAG: peptidoglycan DD-metalloendopeptidase family protein [Anaerolineales bacterium]|nr:peptidoglycan DD-metalloendopeptidase family protein [Anaerolineales bacterium]